MKTRTKSYAALPGGNIKSLLLIWAVFGLIGCGTQKRAKTNVEPPVEPVVPAWHTCLIQSARATITTDEDRLSANITMQTVHDSMLVISVMPMLGIEMLRLEATPMEVIAIDKIHGQYARTTYAELNRQLTPAVNWDVLQQIATAELPTGSENARMLYTFGDDTRELTITYPKRQTDVPVRVSNQKLDKYKQIDISRWL